MGVPLKMASRRQTSLERQYSYREAFLAALSRHTSSPSEDWPTVRCWKKRSFDRVFKQIATEIGDPKPTQSNVAILNWIVRLGLVCAIETDGELFYLLEIGASTESAIDPTELMMASQPSGVICYFSAISLHSLTTQIPSHHHVAVVTDTDRAESNQDVANEHSVVSFPKEEIERPAEERKHGRSKPNPFGQLVFSYAGVPYYKTRRTRRLLPGVQERINGPRGRFRITTLEQTLLDTLHKPQNCGGAAVVLEAWAEAVSSQRIDEERLAAYLTQMDYPSTTRRLGAMLNHLEHMPGKEIGDCLTDAKERIGKPHPSSEISLLPGLENSHLDEEWQVRLP
jgi:predicted transcriptional regulator of viral defense system